MNTLLGVIRNCRWSSGITTVVVGAVLLAFSVTATAQYEDYIGSDECAACHEDNWNQWQRSGHPYKLMKGEDAKNRPIPLPVGFNWSEISYVIGGYKWKSRYMDENGYIITNNDTSRGGHTQYNYMTDEWVDYHEDDANGTRPYADSCGKCHTSAWIANPDPTDLTHNQDGLAGIHGTFVAGGIHCEECHGPGADFSFTTGMLVDTSVEACGRCHYRTAGPDAEVNQIDANGSDTTFVKHHEQFNEFLASPHAASVCTPTAEDRCPTTCTDCHNPHSRGEFSIWKEGERVGGMDLPAELVGAGAQCGVDCHKSEMASFKLTSMYDYDVTCTDCHMSLAVKSGQQTGTHEGDVMTHIFSIDTDPMGDMFSEDNKLVKLDENGQAAVTMDYACQRCHETAALEELAKFAQNFHDEDKSLENIGFDPGLTGVWWGGQTRDGEGIVLDVSNAPGGGLFLFASFYTYDILGAQVYLIATSSSIDGTTATVDVFITEGRVWGADYDPNAGETKAWGSGSFTFPTCGTGTFTLTPNAEYMGLGFTEITYDLTRDVGGLEYAVACPTFVNNDGSAAAAGK